MIKKRLITLLSDEKKYIGYIIFWQWVSLLSQIIIIFHLSSMIEEVYVTRAIPNDIKKVCIIFIICILVRFLSDRFATKASYKASVNVKKILRKEIYEKMLRLGASYQDKVPTSEIMQVSTEGVEQLEIYFGKYLPQLFYSLLAPITLFIVLLHVSTKASIVLLICVPLIPISIVVVQKIAKRLLNKYWGIYTQLGDSFLENLQGLTTLKIYQADEMKAKEMDKESEHFRNITMKVLTMQLNSTSVMDIVAYGGAAVGMVTAISQYLSGALSLSGCLQIVLLASEFFIPLRLLGSYFHIAMNGMAASDKIFHILDLEEPTQGAKEIENVSFDITLKNVYFSYEENREILKGIDLEIPAHSFISIVGESGSGKSTIANLLTGRNKGFTGDILIGETRIEEIKESNLFEHIVSVRHNSYLFKGTVRENLLMAKPNASEKDMEDVLEKVNLLGFLNTQNGLDTILSEKANNLSGGQRQRLAIARALLKDGDVYIFDEASSNVDVESEEEIMKAIHELAKEKTIILISHRLANVVDSDKIYLLKDGKILEEGTQDELINKDGEYKKLFYAQKNLEEYGKEGN